MADEQTNKAQENKEETAAEKEKREEQERANVGKSIPEHNTGNLSEENNKPEDQPGAGENKSQDQSEE